MKNFVAPVVISFFAVRAATAALVKNASSNLRALVSSGNGGGTYGENSCPCVGIDNLKGYYAAQIDYYHVQQPAETGASCDAWEMKGNVHPACRGSAPPMWCNQRWCYIDPCNCKLDVTPKITHAGVLYKGAPAFWSYATCGGMDFYTKDAARWTKDAAANINEKECHERTIATCTTDPKCGWDGKQCLDKDQLASCQSTATADSALQGDEDCQCVGLGGRTTGKAFMYVDKTQLVPYPPDVGSKCHAWEMDSHPDCKKDGDKPSWCSAKWCFVDPCKCKTKEPPKTVMGANQYMRFQGKTAFWSYSTCGSEDTWTKDHDGEYCVHYKSKEACTNLERCAWNGKECLGKALVDICDRQEATGALGMEAPLPSSAASTLLHAALIMLVMVISA